MENEAEKTSWILTWFKESVTVKLVFIGVLALILLIPSAMVDNLISERADRQQEVIKDISYNFAGSQQIKGPVLVIPYKAVEKDFDSAGKEVTKEVIQNLFVLPDDLNIKANLNSQKMHRGIYDAIVYKTTVHITGNFTKADLNALGLTPDQLMLDKAKITFSLSDLKGLKTNPVMKVGSQVLTASPTFNDESLFNNGLQVAINLTGINDDKLSFDYSLDITGSDELSFLQLGKTTDVVVNSNWNSPSFDGRFLPDTRKINDTGFSAH